MTSPQDTIALLIRERTGNGKTLAEFSIRLARREIVKLPKQKPYKPTARDSREALARLVVLAAAGVLEARQYLEENFEVHGGNL